ncbi:hypothetical protein ES703_61520 [subsurface metagenome]
MADRFATGHGHRALNAGGCRQNRITGKQYIGLDFASGALLAGSPVPAVVSAVVDIGSTISTSYQRVVQDIQAADIGGSAWFTAAPLGNIEVNGCARRNGVCHPVDITTNCYFYFISHININANHADKQGRAGSVV